MIEALNIIIERINDSAWEKQNRKRFEKRIRDNFN